MTIWRKYEPTLAEILEDSWTRVLMRVDGAKRSEIEALFEKIGRTRRVLGQRSRSSTLGVPLRGF